MALTDRRLWQLEGDLRQAMENYFGQAISGPWDDLIETLAAVIHETKMDLATAGRIELLFQRISGVTPDRCDVCKCPAVGMVHP